MKSDGLDVLKLLIQAGNPIIAMETADEPRAVRLVRDVAKAMELPLAEWSVTEGLVTVSSPVQTLVEAGKVAAALRYVKDTDRVLIFLFKDLGPHCKDPAIVLRPPRPLFRPRLALVDPDLGRRRGAAARGAAADRAPGDRLAG